MKMHRIVTYVIDHEDYGLEEYLVELDNSRTHFIIMGVATTEIGEWSDDHILNQSFTPKEVFDGYFKND